MGPVTDSVPFHASWEVHGRSAAKETKLLMKWLGLAWDWLLMSLLFPSLQSSDFKESASPGLQGSFASHRGTGWSSLQAPLCFPKLRGTTRPRPRLASRILDLGWRHTARPLHKKGVGASLTTALHLKLLVPGAKATSSTAVGANLGSPYPRKHGGPETGAGTPSSGVEAPS